jgi:DUF4097 and DUF4098 domain-containing protein YvlB
MISVLNTTPVKAEEIQVPLSEPGKPAILMIDSPNATVTVEAYEGDNIIFDLVEGSASGDDHTGRGHRNNRRHVDHDDDGPSKVSKTTGMTLIPSTPGYRIGEKNNRVEFEMDWSTNRFTVNVKVPVNTSLKLDTSNGGDMTISGVNGDHELQNANGGIYAHDISGSLVAETSNGGVEITFVSIKGDTPMAFSTVNGDVDVTFPADFAADLRIDPGRGQTYTNFDMKVDKSTAPVRKKTRNGGTLIEVQKEIHGSINGGGSLLRFETFNGSVYIRKAD